MLNGRSLLNYEICQVHYMNIHLVPVYYRILFACSVI